MDTTALLTVRELRVRAVHVPMALPLRTSSGTIQIAPLALIDLLTEQGITGHTYLFCYTPLVLKPVVQLLENLSPLIRGDVVAPLALERKLQGMFRLLGLKGVTGMALAGIDMAAWDALARAQGLPLARLLGADRERLPAYNSCGLGMIGSHDAPAEAEHLLVHGFEAIKVRLGYAEARTDLDVVWAVRRAIGERVVLMADYNQILSVAEAVRRTDLLQDEDLHWVEEPTLADDYSGHAQIRSQTRIPVQMGENWWGTHEMGRCIAAGASDLGMPDAMKIGGVSGWLRAAALAEAAGMPVSSHLFPEVSAHLLAATPTAHWLEYVDWANPVLQTPLCIELGQAVVSDRPGTGIEWDEDAVGQYLVN